MIYWRPITVSSAFFGGGDVSGSDYKSSLVLPLAGVEGVGFSAVERFWRDEDGIKSELISAEKFAAEFRSDMEKLTGPRAFSASLDFYQPQIMGILNVTPDSFFDGGQLERVDDAVARGLKMVNDGASILDIGGESTRPGAKVVSIEEELDRVVPVIEKLSGETDALISIDTRKDAVMTAAVEAGAGLINDVSALEFDEGSLEAARKADVPVVLMHAQGTPETMQKAPQYEHVLLDVYDYLSQRIEVAVQAGISREKIIVDPGIGFGKTLRHNAILMEGLSLFHGLGVPLLLGCSRKSFIAGLSKGEEAKDRLAGSLASALKGATQGCQILRMHDVAETSQALSVWRAL